MIKMIERTESAGIPLLVISGDIGSDDTKLLQEAADILVGPGAKLMLDLSAVTYINSTGINTLVRINAQANQQDQRVVFAAPSPIVEGVFRTTQLDRFFTVLPTVADAVELLKN